MASTDIDLVQKYGSDRRFECLMPGTRTSRPSPLGLRLRTEANVDWPQPFRRDFDGIIPPFYVVDSRGSFAAERWALGKKNPPIHDTAFICFQLELILAICTKLLLLTRDHFRPAVFGSAVAILVNDVPDLHPMVNTTATLCFRTDSAVDALSGIGVHLLHLLAIVIGWLYYCLKSCPTFAKWYLLFALVFQILASLPAWGELNDWDENRFTNIVRRHWIHKLIRIQIQSSWSGSRADLIKQLEAEAPELSPWRGVVILNPIHYEKYGLRGDLANT